MSAPATAPPQLGPRTRARLTSLRRRARLSLAVRGLFRLTAAGAPLAAASFALDWLLRLGWETRVTLWVVTVTAAAAAVWTWLLRPLLAPLGDVTLARAVEGAHPELGWRLVSAVQFAEPSWTPPPGASLELATRVIREADDLEARFQDAVPARPVLRRAAALAAVAAAAALVAAAAPDHARTWWERDVLLSPTARWPLRTRLAWVGHGGEPRRIVAGEDLTLTVAAAGDRPRRVVLEGDLPGGSVVLDAIGADLAGRALFRAVVERVARDHTLVAVGGDARLGPLEVRVVTPPWLESLRAVVTPPAYTGLAARELAPGAEAEVPAGSRLALTARANEPLVRAWVEAEAAGVAAVRTASLVGERGLEVAWTVRASERVVVHVADRDGLDLAPPPSLTVTALPDLPPRVALELLGVGRNVTAAARIRYRLTCQDDYAVAAASLAARAVDPAPEIGEAPPPRELTRSFAGAVAQGTLDVAQLAPGPQAALSVWGAATDASPDGGQRGTSPTVELRVVAADELLDELLRKLQEVRLRLLRLGDDEEAAAAAVVAPQADADRARAAEVQRDVAARVGRCADDVAGVVAELATNQLLDDGARGRLRAQVVGPLRRLRDGPLAEAARRAELAARAAAPGTEWGEVAGLARGAARTLREVAAHIGRLEDVAELAAELKRLIREQRELLERARRR